MKNKRKDYFKKYYEKIVKMKPKSNNKKHIFSKKDIKDIIFKYSNGDSTYKIAEYYSIDKGRIRRVLLKNNIIFRTRGGYEEITGTRWGSIKGWAKDRGIDFLITIEQAWELFIKQDRKCALTGDILVFAKNTIEALNNFTTASLDRIDSSKGYTLDNIQ